MQQVRNPEILVDLEGGEFMHGNILDANSTNKLVKDAIDNSIIEGNYATKDLLENKIDRATKKEDRLNDLIENETSTRSSKDTELENSIAEEKTRAQNKEKEISDLLTIVNGDSSTDGSFRKAIADVIASAPEDLDTLKEIADKLAGNDDLHTALNQAITEKADASTLANEVTRATAAEATLQNSFDQFVSKTATKEQFGVVKEDGYNDYVSKHGLHFTKALQEYASKQMVNSNNQEHTWTSEQVKNVCNILNLKIPDTSTIEDVTYTANMAYADFYPELLNEHQCIKYAVAVANDKDGYTGIQFCRWMADVVGKKENIDWDKFK